MWSSVSMDGERPPCRQKIWKRGLSCEPHLKHSPPYLSPRALCSATTRPVSAAYSELWNILLFLMNHRYFMQSPRQPVRSCKKMFLWHHPQHRLLSSFSQNFFGSALMTPPRCVQKQCERMNGLYLPSSWSQHIGQDLIQRHFTKAPKGCEGGKVSYWHLNSKKAQYWKQWISNVSFNKIYIPVHPPKQ